MINKEQSRKIRSEIRRVLLDVWDPIGIRDEPNAQDEYDSYLGQVFELLIVRSSDRQLAEYLFEIVHDHMGLDRAKIGDMETTVRALRKIDLVTSRSE